MAKRLIEVFAAGCYVCDNAVKQIKELACPNCEVIVYDLMVCQIKCNTSC